MDGCIFCKILAGDTPNSTVYRGKLCTAIMDIQPVNPGHLLVIPNHHATYLADLDEEVGAHMFRVAHRIAAALRESGVNCEGVNLFLADGEAAMQEVLHVHLHVLPRFEGDDFGLKFGPDYGKRPDRSELDRIAADVKRQL